MYLPPHFLSNTFISSKNLHHSQSYHFPKFLNKMLPNRCDQNNIWRGIVANFQNTEMHGRSCASSWQRATTQYSLIYTFHWLPTSNVNYKNWRPKWKIGQFYGLSLIFFFNLAKNHESWHCIFVALTDRHPRYKISENWGSHWFALSKIIYAHDLS